MIITIIIVVLITVTIYWICITCLAICLVLLRHYLTQSSQQPWEIVLLFWFFPFLRKKTEALNQWCLPRTVVLSVHAKEASSSHPHCRLWKMPKCFSLLQMQPRLTPNLPGYCGPGLWASAWPLARGSHTVSAASHSHSRLHSKCPLWVSMRTQPYHCQSPGVHESPMRAPWHSNIVWNFPILRDSVTQGMLWSTLFYIWKQTLEYALR